jgi:hypothetical protein
MIWWWLKHSNWSYYGGDSIELTEQWQTVTLWRGCITPGVDYAACSIAIETPEAEFWVDDMSLKILEKPTPSHQ